MKRIERIVCLCKQCQIEFEKTITSLRVFCSRNCKISFQRGKTLEELHGEIKASELRTNLSNTMHGENNPNFGNKWTDEQKSIASVRIQKAWKEKGEDWRKENFGKSNRGKTRTKEFIAQWHSRHSERKGKPLSEEHKRKVGKKSKEKFTNDYKKAFRLKMEQLGKWIPLNNLTDWELYKKETHWIEKMWNKIVLPDDFNEIGVFCSRLNSKGYTRDHIFSKKDGFELKVFPEILRHPANCHCMLHKSNASKSSSSEISLVDLFKKIKEFDSEWKEQMICIEKISQFENGIRWERFYD